MPLVRHSTALKRLGVALSLSRCKRTAAVPRTRQARLQLPALAVTQEELAPGTVARPERAGQVTERTPAQTDLVRSRQRVNASTRGVGAVIDERLPRAEAERQLQPVIEIVGGIVEIQQRLDDAVPKRSAGRTGLERGMV